MADETTSSQQAIDNAAKALEQTPVPPTPEVSIPEQKPIDVPVAPIMEASPPLPPVPEPMIIPTKEKEERNTAPPGSHPIPEKKKSGKGLLIATLLFFIFTLPIALYYVTQSPQFAEIRSRAAGTGTCSPRYNVASMCAGVSCNKTTKSTCESMGQGLCCQWNPSTVTNTPIKTPTKTPTKAPTPTKTQATNTSVPSSGGASCPANIAACKPGGASYFAWLPNHVICGTCDKANNFNTCGTWEGEAGVVESQCCTGGCNVSGSSYPWHFANQCLSTHTSKREVCYHSQTDCNRVVPCSGTIKTPGPTHPPGSTNTPILTNTNTPIPTNTPTTALTATPTTANTPAPGRCDASCDNDNNCESNLSCITSNGVKRCRNTSCPNESSCSCPAATPTTYYANNTPTPTSVWLIAEVPTTPTQQPTPKIPVAGIGPGIFGAISVVGSILLLIVGLVL